MWIPSFILFSVTLKPTLNLVAAVCNGKLFVLACSSDAFQLMGKRGEAWRETG